MSTTKVTRPIDPKFHMEAEDTAPYISIVKTSNGEPIPDDEPLMLFRGRDRLTLPMLREYRRLCVLDGCNEFQLKGIDNRIAAFEKFAMEHEDRMKQPGITRGL